MENFTFDADIAGMADETAAQNHERSSLSEQRILDAARKLFMEHGFSAVSGDQLCKEARVSKTTLYKYFGDMTGVLEAVVIDEGDVFAMSVGDMPDTEAAFWTTMVDFGTRLLTLLNRPFCIKLDRMLHEEARANPQLALAFYDAAYGRGHREIEALVAHGKARGFIKRTESAADLADHLISMWEGLRFIRARLGLSEKPFEAPAAWSRQCVETLFAQQ